MPGSSGSDELIGDRNCIEETGTCSGDIEGRDGPAVQCGLNEACVGRGHHIRGDGGTDDQIEIGCGDAGLGKRFSSSIDTQTCRTFAHPGEATFADTRARAYPFIRSIDECDKLVVGHHPTRQATAGGGEDGTDWSFHSAHESTGLMASVYQD